MQSDFEQLHEAMKAEISKQIPVLSTVEAYNPGYRDAIKTPAVLLEIVDMEPGRKTGDGRLPVTAMFVAHCCLSVKTERVELEVRNFAAKLMQVIDRNRWGLGDAVEQPVDLGACPGLFKPDDKGFESWVVVWKQTVHLGDVWQDADFLPTDVYIGEAPNIGAAHKDDYEKVTDE